MHKYVFVEARRIMQRRMLYFKKFISSRPESRLLGILHFVASMLIGNGVWLQCLAESLKKPLRYFNTWNSG